MNQLSEKQELNLLIVAWAAALGALHDEFRFSDEEEARLEDIAAFLKELKDDPDMQDMRVIPEVLDRLEAAIAKRKEME